MNISKISVEILEQEPNIEGIYKQIELAGRTCYKSENNITVDSAQKFVERMLKSKHGAMLEHGTLYLDIPVGSVGWETEYIWRHHIVCLFKANKYSVVKQYCKTSEVDGTTVKIDHYAITTNWRVFSEQIDWTGEGKMRQDKIYGWQLGLEADYVLQFMTPDNKPTPYHEKRITIKFSTDRGVTAEMNRHRVDSIAEQSTRYCNFSKNKFGNEITISENADITKEDVEKWNDTIMTCSKFGFKETFRGMCDHIANNLDDTFDIIDTWMFANYATEWSYMRLINLGWTAQQARRVLPLDLHSDIVHTAFESDWKRFVEIRSEGTTGAPHPDMKIVADKVKELLNL